MAKLFSFSGGPLRWRVREMTSPGSQRSWVSRKAPVELMSRTEFSRGKVPFQWYAARDGDDRRSARRPWFTGCPSKREVGIDMAILESLGGISDRSQRGNGFYRHRSQAELIPHNS